MSTDYTKPPTEEFKMLSEIHTRHPTLWLTLQKSVMNDYWFERTKNQESWDPWYIDHFMHKIYYCWQEYMKSLYQEEE
jgi:hypothetical protein